MRLIILETWKLCAIPLPDFPTGEYVLVCRQYFNEDQAAEAYDLLARLRYFDGQDYKYQIREIQEDGIVETY